MSAILQVRRLWLVHTLCLFGLLIPPAASATGAVVIASAAGARLDSNLMRGGGTDDTGALQAVLNRAALGKPTYLIIDGPALVSGLDVYGNTTLECIEGGGLYLKDGSSRPIVRNMHRSAGTITDTHIAVRGCFLNGNRAHQPGRSDSPRLNADGKGVQQADNSFITGLQFLGVRYLSIENCTLWNTRAFGSLIGNGSYIDIENVIVDHGEDRDSPYVGGTDGLHFKGPLQFLSIENVKLRTGDDGIALNTDDAQDLSVFGPYVRHGPITDVSINNVQLKDMWQGMRLLSATSRIDRVTISNITGTVRGHYLVDLSHWVNPAGLGNFGSIVFDRINVDRVKANPARVAEVIDGLSKKENAALSAVYNGGYTPLITVDAHVESLTLSHVVTKVTDDLPVIGNRRPILRLGPDAVVRTLSAQLTILDSQLKTIPLQIDNGAHVEHLNLALNWQGDVPGRSKNPITTYGGTIGQLHWVNTPPQFVEAKVLSSEAVAVTFSQDVKASDWKAGARIQVDGKLAGIARAERADGRLDTVRYTLKAPIPSGSSVTYAYVGADGNLQNFSGDQLLSLSKQVAAK